MEAAEDGKRMGSDERRSAASVAAGRDRRSRPTGSRGVRVRGSRGATRGSSLLSAQRTPSGLQRRHRRLPCSGVLVPGAGRASPVPMPPFSACRRHYPARALHGHRPASADGATAACTRERGFNASQRVADRSVLYRAFGASPAHWPPGPRTRDSWRGSPACPIGSRQQQAGPRRTQDWGHGAHTSDFTCSPGIPDRASAPRCRRRGRGTA